MNFKFITLLINNIKLCYSTVKSEMYVSECISAQLSILELHILTCKGLHYVHFI